MSKNTEPEITDSKDHFTEISFILDFDRFDQKKNGITKDFIEV